MKSYSLLNVSEKKMRRTLLFILLIINTTIGIGQVKVSGFVFSTGIEKHEFNSRKFDGTSFKFRYFKGFDTTPIVAFGIDSRVTFSDLETPSRTISATTFSIGPIVMVSVPLKWFSIPIPKGAPEGGGPFFYAGYNFIDDTKFDDLNNTNIKGDSFKVGTQLGFPVTDWLVLGLAIEYSDYSFSKDSPNLTVFENTNRLTRSGWEYSIVIGFPIL